MWAFFSGFQMVFDQHGGPWWPLCIVSILDWAVKLNLSVTKILAWNIYHFKCKFWCFSCQFQQYKCQKWFMKLNVVHSRIKSGFSIYKIDPRMKIKPHCFHFRSCSVTWSCAWTWRRATLPRKVCSNIATCASRQTSRRSPPSFKDIWPWRKRELTPPSKSRSNLSRYKQSHHVNMLPELFVAFWATFEVVERHKISCDNLANKVLILLLFKN